MSPCAINWPANNLPKFAPYKILHTIGACTHTGLCTKIPATCHKYFIKGQAAKDSHPFSEVSVTSEGFQKGSDQSRYLYQQLSRIEKALILLGPSSFHSPHSNRQALQQVRDMRSYLEDGTDQFSCVDLAGPPQDQ